MPDTFLLRDWQSFYMLTGTASATLIGLIFIAISFGARLVLTQSESAVRAFVTPTAIHFGMVLGLSILLLLPTYTLPWLAIILLAGGLIGMIYVAGVLRQMVLHHRHKVIERTHWFWHLFFPGVDYLLVFATGLGLWFGFSWLLNPLALAVAGLIVVGLRNAFDLMMWIARQPF